MAATTTSTASTRPSTDSAADSDHALAVSSTHHSLSRAVHARKPEYVRPHRIRVKVGSWNVAACPGTDKDLASWFVEGRGLEPHWDTHLALADLELREDGIVEDNPPDPKDNSSSDARDSRDPPESSRSSGDAASHTSRTSETRSEEEGKDEAEPSIRLVGGAKVGLYVLGLQEIVSLNVVTQSLYGEPSATVKWQTALEAALPKGYELIASQQLSGLLLLVYASSEVAASITDVSTVSVGTGALGLLGYMGNKGGVSTRIVLGETTRLVFTNCHLASGPDPSYLDRRCWDYNRIVSQTQFSPINYAGVVDEEGERIGDEDFAFFFGDLNFRLDGLPGEDIRRILMLHTRGEYDVHQKDTLKRGADDAVIIMHNKDADGATDGSRTPQMISRESTLDDDNSSHDEIDDLPDPDDFVPDPHSDPVSLQATLDSLLPHDQLHRVMKQRKAFHEGWHEGPITFLPSYKYDVGTIGLFDSSEKQRAPSWCDRILYRTNKDVQAYKTKVAEEEEARKKDEEMKQRGIDHAADDESVLFDYDPDRDSAAGPNTEGSYEYDEYDDGDDGGLVYDEAEAITTREGFQDKIKLDIYTTHQRVTSSDHKPIVALFTLDYDAVVPELKAKVHTEVARELDREENEGRPRVTVVLDGKDGKEDFIDGSGDIDFGPVCFMRPKQRSLTIANTGQVAATICPVERPNAEVDGSSLGAGLPDWLQLSIVRSPGASAEDQREGGAETSVTLDPGETASIVLTIQVTSISHLRALNAGTAALEDVLILRVANGRDYFMSVTAFWLPSSFGRSIDELIRVPSDSGGIRAFAKKLREEKGTKDPRKSSSIPYSLDVYGSSPPELYKLTEAIEGLVERVIADENMLEEVSVPRDEAAWPFGEHTQATAEDKSWDVHRAALIEALDTDTPSKPLDALSPELTTLARLEIAAEVLLLFLRALTDGIVPAALFAKIEVAVPSLGTASSATRSAREIEDDKSAVLDILSAAPYHNISFVFVTSMLAKIAAEVAPLSAVDLQALNSRQKKGGVVRSLSFRRSGNVFQGVDEAAIQRRLAWESRVAEIFGPAVCRMNTTANAKERKTGEDKMKNIVEIFMRRRVGG